MKKNKRYGKQESFRLQGKTAEQEKIIRKAGREIETRKGGQSVEQKGEIADEMGQKVTCELFANSLRTHCEVFASCFLWLIGSSLSIFVPEASDKPICKF